MTRRMLIAVLALIGLFVATYLWFFKLGIIGSLACKIDGCEKVNTSPWALLFGHPVAMWGVLYYVAMFAVSYGSTLERFADDRRAATALVVLAGWGVLFSAYLTYREVFTIEIEPIMAPIVCQLFISDPCSTIAPAHSRCSDRVSVNPNNGSNTRNEPAMVAPAPSNALNFRWNSKGSARRRR